MVAVHLLDACILGASHVAKPRAFSASSLGAPTTLALKSRLHLHRLTVRPQRQIW